MRKVERPKCPDFMLKYLADGPFGESRYSADALSVLDDVQHAFKQLIQRRTRELRAVLNDVFANKCCYCESPLGASAEGGIENFRPKSAYPHLGADWRNIYLACPMCNRSKGARFPLKNAVPEHAKNPPYSYLETIGRESPLLLDPCHDDPFDHLKFMDDGLVAGISERGKVTVQVMALNRSNLVEARKREISICKTASSVEVQRMTSPGAAYSQAVRQTLEQRSSNHSEQDGAEALLAQQLHDAKASAVDTEKGSDLQNYGAVARYIDRIRIENFGPIRLVTLDLTAPHSSHGPCFALLGENGVGKSTVLRALAIALSGKNYAKRLRLTSKKLLSEKTFEGEVRVGVSGQPDIVMTLRRNKAIEFSSEGSSSLILAYGATRLLPRGRHKPKAGLRHAKIDNLFDPFLPMSDPKLWLEKVDPVRLRDVNDVFSRLLPEDLQIELVRHNGRSKVNILLANKAPLRIDQLSDGYQSMLGMAVDIMQVMYPVYDSMKDSQGVVLIDELGNHFHPAWRLRCVAAMRAAFPNIQFIYSTHDPLCLRGLEAGEVAVLRRDRLGSIYAMENLPPVNKLRVEQLLTSEHFGMRSTLDPDMEDDVRAYETLMENNARTESDEADLDALVQKLTDVNYLGTTRRERLALKLVDFEGEQTIPGNASIDVSALSEATVRKLRLMMSEVAPIQIGQQ